MLEQYQKIFEDQVFNYEEALERLGVTQEKVDLLREETKCSRLVPKIIHDKFVRNKKLLLKFKICKLFKFF
jgi:hypothetical protein